MGAGLLPWMPISRLTVIRTSLWPIGARGSFAYPYPLKVIVRERA